MNQQENLAALVRGIRSRLGLTQEKFAAKLRVMFPTINRWENGKARPSPLAMQQIAEMLRGMQKDGDDLRTRFFPENR